MGRMVMAEEQGCGEGCCAQPIGDIGFAFGGSLTLGGGGLSTSASASAGTTPAASTSPPPPSSGGGAINPLDLARLVLNSAPAPTPAQVSASVGAFFASHQSMLRGVSISGGPAMAAIQPMALAAPAPVSKKKIALAGAGVAGVGLLLWKLLA